MNASLRVNLILAIFILVNKQCAIVKCLALGQNIQTYVSFTLWILKLLLT